MKNILKKELRNTKTLISRSIIVMSIFITIYTIFESWALYNLVLNISFILFLYLIIYFSLDFKKEITSERISLTIKKFKGYNRYVLYKLITAVSTTIITFTGIILYNYVLNKILFEQGMETEIYSLVMPLETNIIIIGKLVLITVNIFLISYLSISTIENFYKEKNNYIIAIMFILISIAIYFILRNLIGNIFPFYLNIEKMKIVKGDYGVEKDILKLKYYIYYSENRNILFKNFTRIFDLKNKNTGTTIFTTISVFTVYFKLVNLLKKNPTDENKLCKEQ